MRPVPAADRYRRLLKRLDAWFAAAVAANPGTIPCRAGCSACCHGPFDISVADAALVARGLEKLAPEARADVVRRARAILAKALAKEPGWPAPYDIAAIGGERFDALSGALHAEPCPLLDDAGRCRIYEDRPLVCRLIGLSMRTPAGRVIENCCPIQSRFPAYAALPPQPFDLEGFEEEELDCLREAARELFSDEAAREFETFIAAFIASRPEAPPAR